MYGQNLINKINKNRATICQVEYQIAELSAIQLRFNQHLLESNVHNSKRASFSQKEHHSVKTIINLAARGVSVFAKLTSTSATDPNVVPQ